VRGVRLGKIKNQLLEDGFFCIVRKPSGESVGRGGGRDWGGDDLRVTTLCPWDKDAEIGRSLRRGTGGLQNAQREANLTQTPAIRGKPAVFRPGRTELKRGTTAVKGSTKIPNH